MLLVFLYIFLVFVDFPMYILMYVRAILYQ